MRRLTPTLAELVASLRHAPRSEGLAVPAAAASGVHAAGAAGGSASTASAAPTRVPPCRAYRGSPPSCSRAPPSSAPAGAQQQQPPCSSVADAPSTACMDETCGCWKCGRPEPDSGRGYFCGGCGAIQPAIPDRDYFSVLGIEEASFDVDARRLELAYKEYQKQLHPDKFGMASQAERRYSDEQATLINQAYSTLRVPLRRAKYMLQQRGLGGGDDSAGGVDPALLMRVMEEREEVDSTQDKLALQGLLDANSCRQRELTQALSDAFREGDLRRAELLTMELTYVHRIAEAIVQKQ